jgi:hypothetical protein
LKASLERLTPWIKRITTWQNVIKVRKTDLPPASMKGLSEERINHVLNLSSMVQRNLSICYREQKNWKDAERYLDQCYENAMKIDFHDGNDHGETKVRRVFDAFSSFSCLYYTMGE